MDIEAIYAAIVDGTGTGDDLLWTRRKLQILALSNAKSGDPEARLGALKVAALLGTKDGLPIADELVVDADPRVRTLAFNAAVAAKDFGLGAIRKAASGDDVEIALAAFELLVRWVDTQSNPAARRALSSPDPRLRAKAADLLGHSGAVGATLALGELLERDPDSAAREAARRALARIRGELPKAVREPWWDEPQSEAIPEPTAAGPTAAEPTAAGPTAAESTAAGPAPEPAAPPQQSAPNPPAAPTLAPIPEEPAKDGRWARLPDPLPDETRALLRLLGMVAPGDRAPVIARLQQAPLQEWSSLMLAASPGSDAALSRGLAWSAQALSRASAVRSLSALLTDPDPSVRAASVEAIGALGSLGSAASLSQRAADADPEVAAAAITAITALALRIGRKDIAQDLLGRLPRELPDQPQEALRAARALLSGSGG